MAAGGLQTFLPGGLRLTARFIPLNNRNTRHRDRQTMEASRSSRKQKPDDRKFIPQTQNQLREQKKVSSCSQSIPKYSQK